MYPLGINFLTNKKKNHFKKDFWKQGPILTFKKFITPIWLRIHKKKFRFNFMISFINPCLIHYLELNMNSWIFQLISPYFWVQKSTIDSECIIFKQ
jgi:hypothetical protein